MTNSEPKGKRKIDGAGEGFAAFLDAVYCSSPVGGLTHGFYRYPARFSPQFARKAIELFTQPHDVVFDPFMGGGTTVVEALAHGRRVIGSDLNQLSVFLARVKTTPLSNVDATVLLTWASKLYCSINLQEYNRSHKDWITYQRNLPWWLRKTLEIALDSVKNLSAEKQRQFARCALLKTAQWALDCRSEIPSKEEFLLALNSNLRSMIESVFAFRSRLQEGFKDAPSSVWRYRRLLSRSSVGIEKDGRLPQDWLPPKLILTSPPYFGVHIRYHRWQVQGRKETPAPYWIVGSRNGQGEAYYTFGDRKKKDMLVYRQHVKKCFTSISSLLGKNSVVVQLVGFSEPDVHLPTYLEIMREVGLEEIDINELTGNGSRIWRKVPNRKWYTDVYKDLPTGNEVLLIHRKA